MLIQKNPGFFFFYNPGLIKSVVTLDLCESKYIFFSTSTGGGDAKIQGTIFSAYLAEISVVPAISFLVALLIGANTLI